MSAKLTDEELLEAQILADPVYFAEVYLRSPSHPKDPLHLRNYQKKILRDRTQKRALRLGRRCVAGTDTILTPRGPMSFEEVAHTRPPIWTVDHEQNIVETEEYEVWENGTVPTLEIKTISGKTQRVSYNHPIYVYTSNGPKMVKAEELTGNEWVGAPKKLTIEDTISVGMDTAYLLGYLVGDGGTSGKSIRFTNMDSGIIEHLREVTRREGITLNKIHGDYEYSLSVPRSGPKSKIQDLVEEHKLRKLSKHKEVPVALYTAPIEEVAAFLGAYWDCDGWVSQRKTGKKEVGISSASKKLLEGTKFLLNRLGINPSMRYKKAKFAGKVFDSWVLELRYTEDIKTFFSEVKLHGEKEGRKQAILTTLKGESTAWQNRMPKECVKALREEAAAQGRSINSLDPIKDFKLYNRSNIKRKTLFAANKLGRKDIINTISNDLLWEPIVSITKRSSINTWDISVDQTENLIGNGLCLSNTGKTVTLAIEAIWKAFTHNDREVLIVAGYDSQVGTLFNLISRMTKDAPDIRDSIERTRMRPYEIWFKNGSVIMGFVGNNSVRGKCFPGTTRILMEDGTTTSFVKDIKVGDKVLSIDINKDSNNKVVGEVSAVHDNGVKDVYALETTSERLLHCTANHKVMVLHKGWTPAEEIKTHADHGNKADFISTVHPNGSTYWARAKQFTKVGARATYDITVEPAHCMVAFNDVGKSGGGVAVGESVLSGYSVKGIHSGGILVHNSANDVYIDEIDSIPNDALIEAVVPITTTYADTSVTVSGTPTGKREYFYTVSTNKEKMGFNEHHYPSMLSPEWSTEKEEGIKLVTSASQYEHEYLAEFGSASEGVFKNNYVDKNLYVYKYSDLKVNPDNYYILGVDWNESQYGVQAVVLEYLNSTEEVLPFNNGEWKTGEGEFINPISKTNALRVFYADAIDPVDYTNMGSVEFIIKMMKKIPFSILAFDRGHGEANYEMLRLSLERGEGPMGTKCTGQKHLLNNMMSVDLGGSTDIIDRVTGTSTKALTKNVMVKNTQLINEMEQLIIPAVDKSNNIVENDESKLIGQMRGYVVERYGKAGEVYASTCKDGLDHRLDALMLGIYGFTLSKSIFHKRDSDLAVEDSDTAPMLRITPGWRSEFSDTTEGDPVVKSNEDGTITYDHGNVAGDSEPDEYSRDSEGNLRKVGNSYTSSKFSHTKRSFVNPNKRRRF